MKKQFWVFAGDNFYPEGGMDDFKDSFDSYELARGFCVGYAARGGASCWSHVYDSVTGELSHPV